MKTFFKYLKLYPKLVAMGIKSKLAYRVDVIMGIVGFMTTNIFIFLTMFLMLGVSDSVGGWSAEMIMFLYGFTLIPKGIDHCLTDPLWSLAGGDVSQGNLDKYLTKPLSPLLQIISSDFKYEGLGEIILGLCFVFIYQGKVGVIWDISNIIPLVIIEIFAPFIFTGIKIFTSSIAFYTKRSMPLMSAIYNSVDYAKYPNKIYGKAIEFILLFIIPFGLIGYLPLKSVFLSSESWFNGNLWALLGIILPFIIIFFLLSVLFFNKSIKKYDSAGS